MTLRGAFLSMVEVPKPLVARYVQGTYRTRQGRGFSEAELKEAGISVANGRKLSIRVDARRRTNLKENVKLLKAWLEGLSKSPSKRKARGSSRSRSG